VGLQFNFDLSPSQTEHLLIQKILQVERETIKLQKAKEEEDEKQENDFHKFQ